MPAHSGGAGAVPAGCPGGRCAAPVAPGCGTAPSALVGGAVGGECSGETFPPPGSPWSPHGKMWGLVGEPPTHSPADLCRERGCGGLLRGQEAARDVGLVGDGGGSRREVAQRWCARGARGGEWLWEAPRSRKAGTCGRKGGGWVGGGVKDMDRACPCPPWVPPYPRRHSRQRHPPVVVAAVPGRAWSQAPGPQSSP